MLVRLNYFCIYPLLPKRRSDASASNDRWIRRIYNGEFFSNGTIHKIGFVEGVESAYPPILLYEANGKKVPFILGKLTPFLEQPQYTAYAVQLSHIGTDLAALPRVREFCASYDKSVFDDAFHGYSFSSQKEREKVVQDIAVAMTRCSIKDLEGKKCIFADAYDKLVHSRIAILLQVETAIYRKPSGNETELNDKPQRQKLPSCIHNFLAWVSPSSVNSAFVQDLKTVHHEIKEAEQRERIKTDEWVKVHYSELDSSEAFLNACSETEAGINIDLVVTLLSEQNHPIISKLLTTLSEEREKFRQSIEAKTM